MDNNIDNIADGIFISYRRDDSERWATRLVTALQNRIGKHNIFIDTDFVPGRNWRNQIDEKLKVSALIIVLIGPDFLTVKDDHGRIRIELDDDMVRYEIRSALSKNKKIFPILVDNAKSPKENLLPPDIRPLSNLHYDSLTTMGELESLCDRIEISLFGDQQRQFQDESLRSIDPKNPILIKKVRTNVINVLIKSGWDIDTSLKGSPAVNVRFPKFRFRFDDKKNVIWLEETKSLSRKSTNWKPVKMFFIEPDTFLSKNQSGKNTALYSAAANPESFLSREGSDKYGGFKEAISKKINKPPYDPYKFNRLISRNRTFPSEQKEKQSREAEKFRKKHEMNRIVSYFDIDCRNEIVTGTKFNPHNDILAVLFIDKVRLWDLKTKKWKENIFECDCSIESFCWSSSGWIAIGLISGELIIWNPKTNDKVKAPQIDSIFKRLTRSQQFSHLIRSVDWSHDERYIVYSSAQFPIVIWDVHENIIEKMEVPFPENEYRLEYMSSFERLKEDVSSRLAHWAGMGYNGSNAIAFQKDGPIFAAGSDYESYIVFINAETKETTNLIQFSGSVEDINFSPNNRDLIIASYGAKVQVVNIANPDKRTNLIGHEPLSELTIGGTSVKGIAFCTNSKIFATLGEDKNIIIWDIEEKIMKSCVPISWQDHIPHTGKFWLSWSKDGALLSCPWEGNRVRIFKIEIE